MGRPHPRTAIIQYAVDGIIDTGVVDGKVYSSPPKPAFFDQLPGIFIFHSSESAEVYGGSEYDPDGYARKIELTIDVMTYHPDSTDDSILLMKWLDNIAREIEDFFNDDSVFFRRLDSETLSLTNGGLIAGSRLTNTIPYVAEYGDNLYAGQRLQYVLTYADSAYIEDKKTDPFNSYLIQISRTEETEVDDILIEGRGDLYAD